MTGLAHESVVALDHISETPSAPARHPELRVRGKAFQIGGVKTYLRGVTYGPFRPCDDGSQYGTPESAARDFQQMAAAGMNAVRVYTAPPRWLLDLAGEHRLSVLVGLPWEQHITFLDSRRTRTDIVRRLRENVAGCADHPAVMGYAVGNEIPTPIVRWHGARATERFLSTLCDAVRQEDPDSLVTYVNYPSTEYLELPFLDFLSFNVYLEHEQDLVRYLSRLQNIAEHQPLVLGEIGLDSRRNGVDAQAHTLWWQLDMARRIGCAGTFVYAWTDEWHRGGFDIDDWDFGLTTRTRDPKPALTAVRDAYAVESVGPTDHLPKVSVIVCTYNGSSTIRETCDHLAQVDYPDYEVVVVNDGSTDHTGDILSEMEERYPLMRVVNIPNGGLSNARNVGLSEAHGEIVAYIDDDAFPDPQWLRHLVDHLRSTDHVGVGGPNLPVPEDGATATCVAYSPGGPNHVLLSDRVAEHIPGCNMCFWKGALEAIGGFDPLFRIAGDDVDLCWRLQGNNGTIGFHPAAVVWHHRRATIKGYLRQQTNYGRAEAMLERKWPSKYNLFGHVAWHGRIYGNGTTLPLLPARSRIYHGVWGTALFQSIYRRPASLLQDVFLMPEWYLLSLVLALIALPAIVTEPWLIIPALLAFIAIPPVAQAANSARHAPLPETWSRTARVRSRVTIAALHILQPLVRLKGRLLQGLAPWRRHGQHGRLAMPWARQDAFWDERWLGSDGRLRQIESALLEIGIHPTRGDVYDRWDLEIFGGLFGSVRLAMATEEHGGGKQMVRIRARPRFSVFMLLALAGFLVPLVFAVTFVHLVATVLLVIALVMAMVRGVGDVASAMGAYQEALAQVNAERTHAHDVPHTPAAAN